MHHHEGTEALAVRMAGVAENALSELVPLFGATPDVPIHIVINDDMDSPQGFAEVLPQNIITLFPAVPPPTSELGDYDDFMRLLLIHELTHIVHLEVIGGVPRYFNLIFGKSWSPNLIQPRWVVEGIATNIESKLTSGGRVRSSLVDMIMRAQIVDDVFPELDDLSNINRRFLFGTFPWMFGGRFFDFIGRRYGDAAIAEISLEYGSRPLPYGLNLIAERATDRTFVELHQEWRQEEEARAEALIGPARARGLRKGQAVPRPSPVVRYPAFSADGKLLLVEPARANDTDVVVLAPDLQEELLRFRTSAGRGTFTDDGRSVVLEINDAHERVYRFADLEHVDLATGRRRRLTHGARASDPSVSKDRVVFVRQGGGRTWLAEVPLTGGPVKELFVPPEGHQVSGPSFSKDGRLVFSLRTPSGANNLALLESQGIRMITKGRAYDVDPVWSEDGRTIYFASDRGGIFNLHAVDLDSGDITRLSEVETGVLEPTVAPGGELFFAHLSAFGFELRRIAPTQGRAPEPPKLRPVATSSATLATFPVETYSPWETLLPKAWLPTTGVDGVGNTFGIELLGADALRQHTYQIGVMYGAESERLGFGFAYTNAQLPTPISLSTSLVATTRPGSFAPSVPEQDRLESIFRFAVGLSVPLGRWDSGHSLSFAYSGELRRGLRLLSDDPFQPGPPLNPDLTLSSFSVTWGLSNVRAFPESISAAAGQSISVTMRMHDPSIGSDLRVFEIGGRYSAYLTMPWLEHHVLAFRLSAAGAIGDARGRSVYVLGGLPVRNILSDVLDGLGSGSDVIRGYPQAIFRANAFYLMNLEYRLPLWVISTGLDTIPFFFDRLYAAVFADAGNTPQAELRLEETKVGLGAELRLDLRLGYVAGYTLRFGYGRGLMEGASHNVFLVLGGIF